MAQSTDIIVIGGGVIGLGCALELLEAGRTVRLIERSAIGSGASHGNCGLITPSHSLPLNRPGMTKQLLRSLWSKDSGLRVRPRLDLAFLLWGLRFMRNCNEAGMLRSLSGRAALLDPSRDLYVEWVLRYSMDIEWEISGLLEVFATEECMQATAPAHEILAQHGVTIAQVPAAVLVDFEPALKDGLAGATLYPSDAQLKPDKLMRELARVAQSKGAIINSETPVTAIDFEKDKPSTVRTTKGSFSAQSIVLATGAWSPILGRCLGLRLPVQAGKGYSITMQPPELCPRVPLLLKEADMAVTPWSSGYRLGGTMEFAGLDSKLRRERIEALTRGAARFLRTPTGDSPVEWCGFRPMSPDDLPIIDRAPRYPNAIIATGHGMMGVSMAPVTAKLVAAMITGCDPGVDPAPYAVTRFG